MVQRIVRSYIAAETGQGMVEYSLVGVLSLSLVLVLLSVFSKTLFLAIVMKAAHAMVTELPTNLSHGYADVLAILTF